MNCIFPICIDCFSSFWDSRCMICVRRPVCGINMCLLLCCCITIALENYFYLSSGLGPQPTIDPLPEYTITQETSEERSWRSVVISGIERRIDMKVSWGRRFLVWTLLNFVWFLHYGSVSVAWFGFVFQLGLNALFSVYLFCILVTCFPRNYITVFMNRAIRHTV